jgi:DNA-binding transcriptional ArsR family regulator
LTTLLFQTIVVVNEAQDTVMGTAARDISADIPDIETITDGARAAVLVQHPLRPRILSLAREPASATQIAAELGEGRQKINYHVRQLYRAGLLKPAGRRKKRNMVEQRFVATARAYVLAPQLVGPLAAEAAQVTDALSAGHLVALASQAQAELATVMEAAVAQGKRVSTLSVTAELRFESAEQREAFARALQHALTTVVAEHSAPMAKRDGSPGSGRPYRLVVGCYPIPKRLGSVPPQEER